MSEFADNRSRLLVMVLADRAARTTLTPLLTQRWSPEAIAVGRRVAYLWCPRGAIDSQLMVALSRAVGDAGTARNMATMMTLRAVVG